MSLIQQMEIYKSNSLAYSEEFKKINQHYNFISAIRICAVLLFSLCLFYYLKTQDELLLSFAAVLFFVFLILMRIHSKLSFQKKIKTALIDINEKEFNYVQGRNIGFDNGAEFIDFHHPYAYDLDVFGEYSLFQHLNRTATFIGKKTLANSLLKLLPNHEIEKNQQAVQELKSKLKWRQEFLAIAKVGQDSEEHHEYLLRWSDFNSKPLSKLELLISYLFPTLFFSSLLAYMLSSNSVFISCASFLFICNLMVLGSVMKRIRVEVAQSDNINVIVHQYGLLLEKIENESFRCEKLIALQQRLYLRNRKASDDLKQLSDFFSRMDSISNLVTAVLFNGSFLFNLHVFRSLINWKGQHKEILEQWLNVIGEFEMLSSLANFSYNNPDFVRPTLNTNYEIEFSDLSHPLLKAKVRVGNDLQFSPKSFMILTGSNMSGKSTFLRSLGINMVLSGIGSVVCARRATVHPLPVLVSMRLSDSLSESESYFFAEIKRLRQIMDELDKNPAFVLLDEILRGTNSDDKRNGTVEVLKKVIRKRAVGAIATHDIEVCLTAAEFPEQLSNKCFEVEIRNNELYFDYKLKEGICQNKSATFLMKKMGVI